MVCAIVWFIGSHNFFSLILPYLAIVLSFSMVLMFLSFFFFYSAGLFWASHKQPGALPKYLAPLGDLPEADHEGNCRISKGKICPLLAE